MLALCTGPGVLPPFTTTVAPEHSIFPGLRDGSNTHTVSRGDGGYSDDAALNVLASVPLLKDSPLHATLQPKPPDKVCACACVCLLRVRVRLSVAVCMCLQVFASSCLAVPL